MQPGDIVLVDRDCHKSHHYGLVLSGAQVVYLDSYPLQPYSMYGAVPLREIKQQLLEFRRAGKLDRVKALLLTNCTFDGIVYNVAAGDGGMPGDQAGPGLLLGRGLVRVRPLRPDLPPAHRDGDGRGAAAEIRGRRVPRRNMPSSRSTSTPTDEDERGWTSGCCPIRTRARIRVYVTHSTHKTLTSLRQGSMIHVHDQDFQHKVSDTFHEAYMTHTSTSPNYQILASLDVGRRQVELEGFELVKKQVEMAMVLREKVLTHPLLSRYFRFLTVRT